MPDTSGLNGSAGLWLGRLLYTCDRPLQLLLQSVMVLCPMLVLGLLWWGRNRGFDITDEGMYLLVSQHPEQVSAAATLAYVYLAPIYHLVGGDIAAFRVIGYVLVVLSALALWYGVNRVSGLTEQSHFSGFAGAGLTVSGALLIYVWFLPTPSYNLLIAVLVNLFAAGVVVGLTAADSGRARLAYGSWFSAGVVLGLCLFVKFPTAILLFLFGCFGSALWPRLGLRMRFIGIGMLLVGFAAWLGCHLIFVQPPDEVYAVFSRGLAYARELDPRYTAGSAITRIIIDSWHLLSYIFSRYKWIYLIAAIAAAATVALPATRQKRATRLDWALLILCGALIYFADSEHWYVAGMRFMTKITPLVGGALLAGLGWRLCRWWLVGGTSDDFPVVSQRRRLLVLLLLIALPFVTAAGTNNPLSLNMALCMGPWFAAVWLVFATPTLDGSQRYLRLGVPAFLACLCTVQVFIGCLKDPYRLHTGLLAQNTPTEIGKYGSVLYLDHASSAFVSELKQAATHCDIAHDSPVLGFYDVPGLVYAIGAFSPVVPWYVGHYPGSTRAAYDELASLPIKVLRSAAIMTTVPLPSRLPEFGSLGVSFPKSYRKCAIFRSPPYPTAGHQLTLWVPSTNG